MTPRIAGAVLVGAISITGCVATVPAATPSVSAASSRDASPVEVGRRRPVTDIRIAGQEATGYALVPKGVPFFLAPDSNAAHSSDSRDRAEDVAAFLVEVHGRRGEFVAVKPGHGRAGCEAPVPGLSQIDALLYVRESDLFDVLVTGLEQDLGGGHRIALAPGVRIEAWERRGTARSLTLKAHVDELPPHSVGKFFVPTGLPGTPTDGPARGKLRYGPFEMDLAETYPVIHYGEERPDGLKTIGSTCMRVTGELVDAPEPEPSGTGPSHILGVMGGHGGLGLDALRSLDDTVHEVVAGTEFTWRDGSRGGAMRGAYQAFGAPTIVNGRKCFTLAPFGEPSDALQVCFPASEVVARDLPSLRPAGVGSSRPRIPKVRTGAVTVGPALDKDIIRRVVRKNVSQVRACYEKRLLIDPNAAGKIHIKWTIGPKGRVESTDVTTDTIGDQPLARCMARAIETWRFPAPRGGGKVIVSYPFSLTPS